MSSIYLPPNRFQPSSETAPLLSVQGKANVASPCHKAKYEQGKVLGSRPNRSLSVLFPLMKPSYIIPETFFPGIENSHAVSSLSAIRPNPDQNGDEELNITVPESGSMFGHLGNLVKVSILTALVVFALVSGNKRSSMIHSVSRSTADRR